MKSSKPYIRIVQKNNPKKEEKNGGILRYLGGASFLLTFFISYFTYMSNQRWNQSTFMDKKYQEFSKSQTNKNVRKMLSYRIPILQFGKITRTIDNDLLCDVLTSKTHINQNYSILMKDSVFVAIRDEFHDYLDELNSFAIYRSEKNINEQQIKKYLRYELKTIVDTNYQYTSTLFKYTLQKFIREYEYSNINVLCKACGLETIL